MFVYVRVTGRRVHRLNVGDYETCGNGNMRGSACPFSAPPPAPPNFAWRRGVGETRKSS